MPDALAKGHSMIETTWEVSGWVCIMKIMRFRCGIFHD